jgi:hypothetical protein
MGLLPHFFIHYVEFGFISRVPASRIPFRCIDEGSLLWVFFVRNNLSGRRHVHFCVETWAMMSLCTMSVLLKMLFELILSLLLLLAVLLCLFSYDNNNCLIVIKNALALSFVVNIGKTRYFLRSTRKISLPPSA